jgi:hypothetical protein
MPLQNWDRVFVSLVGKEDMAPFSLCDATADPLSKDSYQISVIRLHKPQKQEALTRKGPWCYTRRRRKEEEEEREREYVLMLPML